MQTDLSLNGHRLSGVFTYERGQMHMPTDLALDGHRLHGAVHYINGIFNSLRKG